MPIFSTLVDINGYIMTIKSSPHRYWIGKVSLIWLHDHARTFIHVVISMNISGNNLHAHFTDNCSSAQYEMAVLEKETCIVYAYLICVCSQRKV